MKTVKTHTQADTLQDLKVRQHAINQTSAAAMVKKYKTLRNKVEKVKKGYKALPLAMPDLPLFLTFKKEAIAGLLEPANCVGLRMYPAINKQQMLTMVLVGVDEQGENILGKGSGLAGAKTNNLATNSTSGLLDEGQTCPPYPAPKNSF